MNDNLTHVWLNKVWGSLAFSRRLLVWDAYCCHIMDSTKTNFKKLKTESAIIPGGCTGLLQAPDVSWNKPFKTYYREQYEEWMASGDKELMRGGSLKAPSELLVATWICNAWDKVPAAVIKKSFVACGVSNSLDNSEDGDINVIKDDGLLADSQDAFLQKLWQLTTAGGDLTGLTEMSVEEEDTEATADNELTVDEDNFDGGNNNIHDDFLM